MNLHQNHCSSMCLSILHRDGLVLLEPMEQGKPQQLRAYASFLKKIKSQQLLLQVTHFELVQLNNSQYT